MRLPKLKDRGADSVGHPPNAAPPDRLEGQPGVVLDSSAAVAPAAISRRMCSTEVLVPATQGLPWRTLGLLTIRGALLMSSSAGSPRRKF